MPPRFAAWWLARTLPDSVSEVFLGDLEERFRADVAIRGLRAARFAYLREALIAPVRLRALPAAPRAPRTGDSMLSNLIADLRYAARQLGRQPLFTAVAAITLALGIGATTAIVSAVYPILIAPLPYPDGDRIVRIWELSSRNDERMNVGWQTGADVTAGTHAFASTAMIGSWFTILSGRSGEPERLQGQRVSRDYFRTLGVQPSLGRDFTAEEDIRGSGRVAILGNGLWRARFGGDSAIVGKSITLDGEPFTVVGVMPAGFENVIEPKARIWTTLRYNPAFGGACRSCRHLRMVARLKDGVSAEAASREVAALWSRMKAEYPGDYAGPGLDLPALRDDIAGGVRPALLAVLGAVALVLLIACANVTNLLLARASQRQGEFALRTALGAGSGRILGQLLTESLLLSALGGALGVGVAIAGVRALIGLSPAELPRLSAIGVNGPVLVFAIIVTTLTGVVFGVVPALVARRANLHRTMQDTSARASGGRHRTRRLLVVAEMALALVLLVGSGLLLRSMGRLLAVPPGFDAEGTLSMQIQTGGPRFATDSASFNYWEQVVQAVRQVPGVTSAALTSQLPLSGDFDGYGVHVESPLPLPPGSDPDAFRYAVTTGYHETMGIPLRAGRLFNESDRAGSMPVAIVSEKFAKLVLGDQPLGRWVQLGDTAGPRYTVVGIVGDVRQVSLATGSTNGVYIPMTQWRWSEGAMSLVVKGRGDVMALVPSLRAAIRALDADQPIVRVATMDRLVAETAAQRRFTLVLFEAFGAVALLLAAAGIYGVMASTVVERLHEVGVRAALGARSEDILGMILRQGVGMAAVGVVIGTMGAVALAGLIRGLLFGIAPVDPVTYSAVAALLLFVAAVACALPAWRASRVDPARVLRGD